MKMFGIRNKKTGEIAEFDDFFVARKSVTDKVNQEVVERIAENVYKTFPDGRTYIVDVVYKWIRCEYRKDVL